MKGAIKMEPEDFDFTEIPEDCIITNLIIQKMKYSSPPLSSNESNSKRWFL